jgi:leucyl aminopeptidase
MSILFKESGSQDSFAKCYLIFDKTSLDGIPLNESEKEYVLKQLKENSTVIVNRYFEMIIVAFADRMRSKSLFLEQCRKVGSDIQCVLFSEKISEMTIMVQGTENEGYLALAEGCLLGSYQFVKYKTDKKDNLYPVNINFLPSDLNEIRLAQLATTIEAVFLARDMVNEPVSHLNAVQLAEKFQMMGRDAGFSVTVFDKVKIQELKMGGLLAVNQGSIDPPTFSVLEWKPVNHKNVQPIVLVGKGVVYDTGGLSLKPTKDSMDYMKCDMAGGATVAAVLYFAAKCQLPIHLIALIPSTDNRPDGNAYAPGDVITMHSGQTVEVLNTDAEGRLLLADALSYAKKYDPVLVIDVATLTGSAAMAVGQYGIVGMGTAGNDIFGLLKVAGENVYERIVEFPLWEEYGESIKSDIADMKNIGAREAGAISAGKFLEKFVSYPWIHLDIAGPSYINSRDQYRSKGGTATGVRLLIDFLKNLENTIL